MISSEEASAATAAASAGPGAALCNSASDSSKVARKTSNSAFQLLQEFLKVGPHVTITVPEPHKHCVLSAVGGLQLLT